MPREHVTAIEVESSQNRRPRPTCDADRRRGLTQSTPRRETVTRAAASRARASLAAAQDQRTRPEGMTDAEWACVLVRDAEPGTWSATFAVALACEVADRAEARVSGDPRQLGLFEEQDD